MIYLASHSHRNSIWQKPRDSYPFNLGRNKLTAFFQYPEELRKVIYTTNIIESYNRQLRKVTKGKSIFPNDESLLKMLYLSTMDVMEKWTGKVKGWRQIALQLAIHFGDRVAPYIH